MFSIVPVHFYFQSPQSIQLSLLNMPQITSMVQLLKLLQTRIKEKLPPLMSGFFSGSELILRSTRLLAYFLRTKLNPVLLIFILLITVCYPITQTWAQKYIKTPRHNKHSHTWFTDLLICGFGLYLRFGLWDQKKGIDPRVYKRMEIVLNNKTYRLTCHLKIKQTGLVCLFVCMHILYTIYV